MKMRGVLPKAKCRMELWTPQKETKDFEDDTTSLKTDASSTDVRPVKSDVSSTDFVLLKAIHLLKMLIF